MAQTKIDWCDEVKNYVWGCNHGCKYCYAKKMAQRFAEQIAKKEIEHLQIKGPSLKKLIAKNLKNFRPTWLEHQYTQPLPKKPKIIFLNSMSDPAFWKQEWYEKITDKIARNFQHTFIVLTKDPKIYKKYTFPINAILGVTCTTQRMLNEFECNLSDWFEPTNNLMLSIEPIQEKIKLSTFMKRCIDWIIVGPETGQKNTCDPEWINYFYHTEGIPVFMKSSCKKYIDTELRQEIPGSVIARKNHG